MNLVREYNALNQEDLPGIWDLFKKGDGIGTCTICDKIIKTTNGSTTSMHRHVVKIHKITAKIQARSTKSSNPGNANTATLTQLSTMFPLESMLSRMTALDGLTFLVFKTSKDLRRCITSDLQLLRVTPKPILPESEVTIRNYVIRFGEKVKALMKTKLVQKLEKGEYFSLDTDEWTSMANRRYININLFDNKRNYYNLGLVRIKGKASAVNLLNLTTTRLEEFGIDRIKNIVCIVTDGAKVMEKFHRNSGVEKQLCIVHGIQLAVIDVLYSKNKLKEPAQEQNDSEDEEDEMFSSDDKDSDVENNTDLKIEIQEDENEIKNQHIKLAITKVRKISSHFKRSSVNNEKLQELVQSKTKQNEGKNLKVDTRTRWSSLYEMLDRYLEIQDSVDSVVKDIKLADVKLSSGDKYLLRCVRRVLEPVMFTVKELCLRDCNLYTARAALKTLFMDLEKQNNPIANYFVKRLRVRIQSRWTINASVLNYLKTGLLIDNYIADEDSDEDSEDEESEENKRYTLTTAQIFKMHSKDEIKKHIILLVTRLCPNAPRNDNPEVENEDDVVPKKKLKFSEKLQQAVAVSKSDTAVSTAPTKTTLRQFITHEMTLLEKNKILGTYLQKCYNMLITIPPTSVESERSFSSANCLCTKIRTKFSDATLDMLAFLRSLYRKDIETLQ